MNSQSPRRTLVVMFCPVGRQVLPLEIFGLNLALLHRYCGIFRLERSRIAARTDDFQSKMLLLSKYLQAGCPGSVSPRRLLSLGRGWQRWHCRLFDVISTGGTGQPWAPPQCSACERKSPGLSADPPSCQRALQKSAPVGEAQQTPLQKRWLCESSCFLGQAS